MKRLVFVLPLLLLVVIPTTSQNLSVVTVVESVPPDASPLVINWSFEESLSQNEWNGWYTHPYTQRFSGDSVDGQWSLWQSTTDDWTAALQVSDITECVGGVLWYHVCYQMRTNEPPENGEMDACAAILFDERRLFIAELFYTINTDITGPPSWVCNWYKIVNVEATESTIFLEMWDTGEQMSICMWDNISGWCMKSYKVYLPLIERNN